MLVVTALSVVTLRVMGNVVGVRSVFVVDVCFVLIAMSVHLWIPST
jgi:hypothetical protein